MVKSFKSWPTYEGTLCYIEPVAIGFRNRARESDGVIIARSLLSPKARTSNRDSESLFQRTARLIQHDDFLSPFPGPVYVHYVFV